MEHKDDSVTLNDNVLEENQPEDYKMGGTINSHQRQGSSDTHTK